MVMRVSNVGVVVGFSLGWAVLFVRRLVTQLSVAGVSSAMMVFTVAANVGWFALGWRQGQVELVVSAVIYLVGGGVGLVLGFRFGWRFAWWAVAVAVSVL